MDCVISQRALPVRAGTLTVSRAVNAAGFAAAPFPTVFDDCEEFNLPETVCTVAVKNGSEDNGTKGDGTARNVKEGH